MFVFIWWMGSSEQSVVAWNHQQGTDSVLNFNYTLKLSSSILKHAFLHLTNYIPH